MRMAELRIMPPAAKYLKKIKNKRLKALYKEAIDVKQNTRNNIYRVFYLLDDI